MIQLLFSGENHFVFNLVFSFFPLVCAVLFSRRKKEKNILSIESCLSLMLSSLFHYVHLSTIFLSEAGREEKTSRTVTRPNSIFRSLVHLIVDMITYLFFHKQINDQYHIELIVAFFIE